MDDQKIREIRLIRENPRFRRYWIIRESWKHGKTTSALEFGYVGLHGRLVYQIFLFTQNRENGIASCTYGSNGIIDIIL